jgi:uncharacterized membrane protein
MWKLKELWNFILLPAIILLTLDFIYISATLNEFRLQIAEVQRVVLQLKYLGAVLCYFFLIFGLYYFILREHKSVFDAMLFGFVIYGVYDTTTYAVLKKWKLKLMIMDTLWGGALMGLTTLLTYKFSIKN